MTPLFSDSQKVVTLPLFPPPPPPANFWQVPNDYAFVELFVTCLHMLDYEQSLFFLRDSRAS